MNEIALNLDSLALLLFCCQLKGYKEAPVTVDEWWEVEKKLKNNGIPGPATLLSMGMDELIDMLSIEEFTAYKMVQRMKQMPLFISLLYNWQSKGIAIVTKYEHTYPRILTKQMKKRAPLYLFYSGDITLIKDGISIAGMNEVTKKESTYIKKTVDKIIADNYIYVSNNTKGCDTIALQYMLQQGGKAICFIAEHLLAKYQEYHRYIKNGQLVLLSAVDPMAPFDVTHAIDRNSYVCGLSRYQVIISSSINNGATWFTALQNMHQNWTTAFVVDNGCIGNGRLLDMGAIPLYIKDILSDASFEMLHEANKKEVETDQVDVDQMSIFEFIGDENESRL